jgi:hypothetical protein
VKNFLRLSPLLHWLQRIKKTNKKWKMLKNLDPPHRLTHYQQKSGKSWTILDNPGQSGTNPGQSGTIRDNPGQAGTILDNPGQSWTILDNLGWSWTKPGQSGTIQDNPGQSWTILDNPGQILDKSWTNPGQIQDKSWTLVFVLILLLIA